MTTNSETSGKGGFTKGPWVAEGEGIWMLVRHVDSGGVIVATRHRLGGKENEDVMRLIAAAPDLLEALAAAIDWMETVSKNGQLDDSFDEPPLWQSRAAIARAEGEG